MTPQQQPRDESASRELKHMVLAVLRAVSKAKSAKTAMVKDPVHAGHSCISHMIQVLTN